MGPNSLADYDNSLLAALEQQEEDTCSNYYSGDSSLDSPTECSPLSDLGTGRG